MFDNEQLQQNKIITENYAIHKYNQKVRIIVAISLIAIYSIIFTCFKIDYNEFVQNNELNKEFDKEYVIDFKQSLWVVLVMFLGASFELTTSLFSKKEKQLNGIKSNYKLYKELLYGIVTISLIIFFFYYY